MTTYTCTEAEVLEKVLSHFGGNDIILGFFSDRFQSGYVNAAAEILANCSSLLEVRAFSKDREIWIHRSSLGQEFSFRLASEEGKDPERDYFITQQLLDIGSVVYNEDGTAWIRSTVQGNYSLPILEGMDAVEVVNYVRYDDNTGVGNVYDYRIKSFLTKEARQNG